MRKTFNFLVFTATFTFCFIFVQDVGASLITKDGADLRLNVLSAESAFLDDIASEAKALISRVRLDIDSNKLTIAYENEPQTETVSLDSFDGEVVEIKKPQPANSLYVINENDQFKLVQRGVVVYTNYPIEIGKSLDNITLQTESGNRYLSVLPHDAVVTLLRSNIIDRVENKGVIDLKERETSELVYYVRGMKIHNLFDLMSLPAAVDVEVSAFDGDVVSVKQPVWSRVLSFLRV